jgi:hypothetical protein
MMAAKRAVIEENGSCPKRPDIRKRYWKGVLWSPSSLLVAGERPSASSANTLSGRRPLIDIHDSFAVSAILPAEEGRALRGGPGLRTSNRSAS